MGDPGKKVNMESLQGLGKRSPGIFVNNAEIQELIPIYIEIEYEKNLNAEN
jgi:hypothetical protein